MILYDQYRISGTHPLDRSIKCFSDALGVLEYPSWDPVLLWIYLTQCWGVTQFFLYMEHPNWNHRSYFNFLQWSFHLEYALHTSWTHTPLRMLINNPRLSFTLSRVNPTCHPPSGFPDTYHITAPHQYNSFPRALDTFDLLLATPILGAEF